MLEARPPSVAADASGEGHAAPVAEAPIPDELATEVARAVRVLRTEAGLSERAAARILGTSQTQLRRMEDPRYLPSLRSLARVAAAYGHRLRVGFEPRVQPEPKPAAPPKAVPRSASRPKPAPARAKRPATARSPRARQRRRA